MSTNTTNVTTHVDTDVIIIGAGPVGLLLGCRLAQLGISTRILESRTTPTTHSRAIGIHPPALECFAALGIAETMLQRGVTIQEGIAFANTRRLGSLSFKHCPEPFTFILTLPQYQTEEILTQTLMRLAPDALQTGATLTTLELLSEGVQVGFVSQGETRVLRARFVVGCDGKRSTVRRLMKIGFRGRAYPDTYLMGDFADSTQLGTSAGIYLTDEGLIESFPLPGGMRRWVVKTRTFMPDVTVTDLSSRVYARIAEVLPEQTNTMLSAFGVQHYLADRFAKGRVFLAGDAAHVLSPIGGQGMNLGWLDAWALATTIQASLVSPRKRARLMERYALERRQAARTAAFRAEMNMRLGRATRFAPVKYAVVMMMLRTPLSRLFARLFTMRYL